MQSAMVITGWSHEQRVREDSLALVDFLKRECRLRYVADVDAVWRTTESLQGVIAFHAARADRQPFLLAYNGHGWNDGWYFAKENRKTWRSLSYDWIEELLKSRKGPTLIVSDTCHSGSLAERLRNCREPHEAAVIAATSPKGFSYGHLTPDLIKSWRNGDTYLPRRREIRDGRGFLERRSGVAHDRFFFARPA